MENLILFASYLTILGLGRSEPPALSAVVQQLNRGNDMCIQISLSGSHGTHVPEMQTVMAGTLTPKVAMKLGLLIKDSSWCSITILQDIRPRVLATAAEVLRAAKDNTYLVVGENPPVPQDMAIIKQPVIWIKEVKQGTCHVSLHCPKIVAVQPPSWIQVGVWTSNRLTLLHNGMLDYCDNPMKGQFLKFAYSTSFPGILEPSFTGQPVLVGHYIQVARLIAKKFDFSIEFVSSPQPKFHVTNESFTGNVNMVSSGKAFAANAGMALIVNAFCDLVYPHHLAEYVYLTRQPLPVDTYWNVVTPFSWGVWVTTVVTLLSLAIMFWLVHSTYDATPEMEHLVLKEPHKVNFFIYSFCKVTEPDPVLWFRDWSAGKLLVLIWSMFAVLMTMFYASNLRAHLISLDHEQPIDTLQDVVNNGKRVWISSGSTQNRRDYLEATGQSGTVRHKIAVLAEETGGVYDLDKHGGLPSWAPQELAEERAAILGLRSSVPYLHLLDSEFLSRERLHVTKENVATLYLCLVFEKYSLATPLANGVIMSATEFGLIQRYMVEYLSMKHVISIPPKRKSLEVLRVYNLYAPLMFLGGGMVVGIITFMIEFASILAKRASSPKGAELIQLTAQAQHIVAPS